MGVEGEGGGRGGGAVDLEKELEEGEGKVAACGVAGEDNVGGWDDGVIRVS